MKEKMKISDYIVHILSKEGVKYIFGYQGANISHIIDSIGNSPDMSFIETYNEQGAAFAANGYSCTDKLGVAVASSGPGALNLLSGIANAYFESIPCLFITGNVSQNEEGKKIRTRQSTFQELDILAMTQNITKYSCSISSAEEIPNVLDKAINIAKEGRPGAVHIDIPHNIQKQYIFIENQRKYKKNTWRKSRKIEEFVDAYKKSLKMSQRPLILLGGGVRRVQKSRIDAVLNKLKIPAVFSLNGMSAVDYSNPYVIGMVGDYGNRYANYAVHFCDNLLILGSRLDVRQIGGQLEQFAKYAEIFRVDIDEGEIERIKITKNNLVEDGKQIIDYLYENPIGYSGGLSWLEQIRKWQKKYPSYIEQTEYVCANNFFSYLSSSLRNDTYTVCADVGNHEMAVAQSWCLNSSGEIYHSGGLGAMGFALPAAIGSQFGRPDGRGIVICGDGGFQMNLQELQVIAREKLNISIIIVNNEGLGMIRNYQNLALEGRYHGSVWGYSNPDLEKIAKAYEFPFLKVDSIKKYNQAVKLIRQNCTCLIELCVNEVSETIPEMGSSIIEQKPFLTETEWEGIKEFAGL
ncbi:MAG: thiamine pyrophosphate-binding protein [Clostridiales bacterium]|nr:thiamine pyrophosphate-binding protein [Clostridiales bacterium]